MPSTLEHFFWLWRMRNVRQKKKKCLRTPDGPITQARLASQMTSCTEGTRTNPRSDMAKSFAVVQPTFASVGATLSDLHFGVLREGLAPWPKPKLTRTPLSPAPKTTSRALPPSPASSGMCPPFVGVRSPELYRSSRLHLVSLCHPGVGVTPMSCLWLTGSSVER